MTEESHYQDSFGRGLKKITIPDYSLTIEKILAVN